MPKPIALVTNADEFAGPAAVQSLQKADFQVVAHRRSHNVQDESQWQAFLSSDVICITENSPVLLVEQIMAEHGQLDVVISNDVHPAKHQTLETCSTGDLNSAMYALVTFPFELLKACLPHMKQRSTGSIVMITSCRTELPQSGGGLADMPRAAANALMKTASIEFAEHNIAVNAIAPNYYYSEAYFPRKMFIDGEDGAAYIREQVPIGRLGDANELGDLIVYLANLRGAFHTGSIIKFSGGWPVGKPRPTF